MAEVPPFDPGAAADRYLWETMADHLALRISVGTCRRVAGCRTSGT